MNIVQIEDKESSLDGKWAIQALPRIGLDEDDIPGSRIIRPVVSKWWNNEGTTWGNSRAHAKAFATAAEAKQYLELNRVRMESLL